MQGGTPSARDPGRRIFLLALFLGLVLQLPTLGAGFFADDYVHQLVLRGTGGGMPMSRWSLYDFGAASNWRSLAFDNGGHGGLPWWTDADWKARFFRPLTSASLVFDHAVWGSFAPGYHLTSLALWLALLVLARRLFLALGLAPRTAALAVLVFALSDASSVPVGWIANRNALLEALFATGTLLAALRGRFAVALALALAAALSKESGAFAFLVLAATCALRAPSNGPRVRAQVVSAVLAFFAYLGMLAAFGFGTKSLFYATPWVDIGRYLDNTFVLATGGVLALVAPFSLDIAMLVPGARAFVVVAGIVAGWPLVLWIGRRLRGEPAAAVLGVWTVVFLAPQGGVIASDRLLFVPTIGVAGLLALFWQRERAERARRSRAERFLVLTLACLATVGSGLFLLVQNVGLADMSRHVRAKALATEVGERALGRRDVLVLQTENQMQGFASAATWQAEIGDPDVHFWSLNSAPRAVRLTRTDERSFELEALDQPFLDGPFERVYLAHDAPPAVGRTWTTPLFVVTAVDSRAHGLHRIRVELPRSLDEPAFVFVRPVDGVLTRIAMPPIGASIELARAVSTRAWTP